MITKIYYIYNIMPILKINNKLKKSLSSNFLKNTLIAKNYHLFLT